MHNTAEFNTTEFNTTEFNTKEFNTKESTGFQKFEWNDIPYDLRVFIIVCVGISVFICGALFGQLRYLGNDT